MNRFSKNKIGSLIAMGIILSVTIISIAVTNPMKALQMEIIYFYEAELNNCRIIGLFDDDYTGGRGTYKEFLTDCGHNRYPVLLSKESFIHKDKFKEGAVISKKKNSFDLILSDGQNRYNIKIRDPKDQDSRFSDIKAFGLFFGASMVLILFLPNSVFEIR